MSCRSSSRIDPQHQSNATPDKIISATVVRKRNHPYEPVKNEK